MYRKKYIFKNIKCYYSIDIITRYDIECTEFKNIKCYYSIIFMGAIMSLIFTDLKTSNVTILYLILPPLNLLHVLFKNIKCYYSIFPFTSKSSDLISFKNIKCYYSMPLSALLILPVILFKNIKCYYSIYTYSKDFSC